MPFVSFSSLCGAYKTLKHYSHIWPGFMGRFFFNLVGGLMGFFCLFVGLGFLFGFGCLFCFVFCFV